MREDKDIASLHMNANLAIEVSVSLCTYMRPNLLRTCLEYLLAQDASFSYEIVVVDNDAQRSAQRIVESFQSKAQSRNIPLRYLVEPVQNIALARNKGVSSCAGKFVAFIDDDEYPGGSWLEALHKTLLIYRIDGVFGPVIPEYPTGFPVWLAKSGVFDRPRMMTGTILPPANLRTGNALVAAALLREIPGPFDERLGRTGGEDSMLFSQLQTRGHSFCWCDEAVVFEIQEKQRARLSWHLARSYRGGWCFARNTCAIQGIVRGALIVGVVGLLGSARMIWKSILLFRTPKVAAFIFSRGFAGQLGKLGYFLGMSIDVYKKRSLK